MGPYALNYMYSENEGKEGKKQRKNRAMIHADACIFVISCGPVPARNISQAEIKTNCWAIHCEAEGWNLHLWACSKVSRMVWSGSTHASVAPIKSVHWAFTSGPCQCGLKLLEINSIQCCPWCFLLLLRTSLACDRCGYFSQLMQRVTTNVMAAKT